MGLYDLASNLFLYSASRLRENHLKEKSGRVSQKKSLET